MILVTSEQFNKMLEHGEVRWMAGLPWPNWEVIMRRAGRTDANQKEIVDALRRAGASVHVTSSVGGGFPDLVVGFRGKNYLMEVKDPKAAKPLLTPDEQVFLENWTGDVRIVMSPEQGLLLIGAIK